MFMKYLLKVSFGTSRAGSSPSAFWNSDSDPAGLFRVPCRPASAFAAAAPAADRHEPVMLGRVRRKTGESNSGPSPKCEPAPWQREESKSLWRQPAALSSPVPARGRVGNDSQGVQQLLRPESAPASEDSRRDRGKLHVPPSRPGQLWGSAGPEPSPAAAPTGRALMGRNAIAAHDRSSGTVRALLQGGEVPPPPSTLPAAAAGGTVHTQVARRGATSRAHVTGRPGQIFGSGCELSPAHAAVRPANARHGGL